MLSSLILQALAFSALLIDATQISVDIVERNASDDTGIYVCRDINWAVCEHMLSKWGNSTADATCLQLDGQASAIGPDPGLECVLYGSIDCSGSDSLKLRYPGNSWLGFVNWNDKAKSYQCYWVDRSLATGSKASPSSGALRSTPTIDGSYGTGP